MPEHILASTAQVADPRRPARPAAGAAAVPTARSRPASEVLPLTAIRGFAALWVVSIHTLTNLQNHGHQLDPSSWAYRLIGSGQIGVDIFFVLSGFIMSASYSRLQFAGIPRFYYLRIVRVLPLHLVILTAMVAGVAVLAHLGRSPGDPEYFAFSALPYHYTLLFAVLGMNPGWNLPTWSLSIELAAYLVFPFVLFLTRALPRPVRAAGALAGILLAVHTLDRLGFSVTGSGAIARGFGAFFTGMMMQSLFPAGFRTKGMALVSIVAVICLGLAGADAIYWAPFPIAALIPALAGPNRDFAGRLLSSQPAVWLGHVSYSIYLLQAPLLIVWLRLPVINAPGAVHVTGFVATFLAALLASAHLMYRFVEQPSRDGLRRLWARRS